MNIKIFYIILIISLSNLRSMITIEIPKQEEAVLGLELELWVSIFRILIEGYMNNCNDMFDFDEEVIEKIENLRLTCKKFNSLFKADYCLSNFINERWKVLKGRTLKQYLRLNKCQIHVMLGESLNMLSKEGYIFPKPNSSFEQILKEAICLIRIGAYPDCHDKEGNTVIHWACKYGYKFIVKILIKCKANLNIQNDHGFTALMWACDKGYLKIVKLLLEAGAHVNIKCSMKDNALICAVDSGYQDIVKILVSYRANINDKGFQDRTALMVAALRGHKDIAEFLINSGADVNMKDEDGKTALIYVVCGFMADINIIQSLIDAGTSVNIQDNEGRIALHWAVLKGYKKIVKKLIDNNSDRNIRDNEGKKPKDLAIENDYLVILNILSNSGKSKCISS